MLVCKQIIILSVEEKKKKTTNKLNTAKNKVRIEIGDLNDRLKQTREAITKFKEEISKLEGGEEIIDT